MADQINVGIGFKVTGNDDAAKAFGALKAGAAETAAAFDAAALAAKGLADAALGARALSGPTVGIAATAAGTLSAEGKGEILVADEALITAQEILNRLGLEAVAITAEQAAAEAALSAAKVRDAEASTAAAAGNARLTETSEAAAAANLETAGSLGVLSGGVGILTGHLVALAAAFVSFESLKKFIEIGTQFNSTMETARLGIAAVINAQADLADSTGRNLEGADKFAAAESLAADQVQKLRIDSLQTVSTTQQLVDNMQAATGAGINAGLSLDQIRQTVVLMTQAAGAFNIPFSQLNVSLVELLTGHVNIRNRLLQELQITQEQVKTAKEHGQLWDLIITKLGSYDALSTKVAGTYKGILSNIKETVQIFTGDATKPFFDAFEQSAQVALHGVFDFNKADINPALAGLVSALQEAFAGAGDLLGRLFTAAVAGARELASYLEQHKAQLHELVSNGVELAVQFARVLASAAEIVVKLGVWLVDSDLVRATFESLAQLAQFIANNIQLAVAAWALFKVITAPTAIAASLLALTNPITATIVAAGALLVTINLLIDRSQALAKQQEAARQEAIQNTTSTAALVGQYQALATAIESGTLKGAALADAKSKLKTVTDQLIAISPAYQSVLEDESAKLDDKRKAVEALHAAELAELATKRDAAVAQVASLGAEQASIERDIERVTSTSTDPESMAAESSALLSRLDDVKTQLDAAAKNANAYGAALRGATQAESEAVRSTNATVHGHTGDPSAGTAKDAAGLAEAEIQRVKTALAGIQQALDEALKNNQISYDAYFAALTEAQITALTKEQDARRTQLAATTDAGQREKILADIDTLEQDKQTVVNKNYDVRRAQQQKLDNDLTAIQIATYKAQGDDLDAFALDFQQRYGALTAALIANWNVAGLDMLAALFNVEQAKARADEIGKTAAAAIKVADAAAKDVEVRQTAGVLTEQQAREALIQVYQREYDALLKARDAAVQLANQTGAQAAKDRVDQLNVSLAQTAQKLQQAKDETSKMFNAITEGIQGDLATFLGSTITKAKSVGDAIRQLGQSIADTIQRILGAEIAKRIVDFGKSLLASGTQQTAAAATAATVAGGGKAAGGYLVAAGLSVSASMVAGALMAASIMHIGPATQSFINNAANFAAGIGGLIGSAEGGLISGPGTGTSDSIPAMLSHGEYVQPARTVAHYGPGVMEALRQRAIPRDALKGLALPAIRTVAARARFAEGGLVGGAGAFGSAIQRGPSGSMAQHLTTELNIRHDPGLIVEVLKSPEGQRTMIQNIDANPRRIAQSLRGK